MVTVNTLLLIVALVLVLVDIVRASGRSSFTTYAVLLTVLALLLPFVVR